MARRHRQNYSSDREWHLDKKIPISIIATMLVQTATIIWWASSMNSRVMNMEQHITEIRQENKDRAEKLEKVTEFGVEVRNLRTGMDRIEGILDRLLTVSTLKPEIQRAK